MNILDFDDDKGKFAVGQTIYFNTPFQPGIKCSIVDYAPVNERTGKKRMYGIRTINGYEFWEPEEALFQTAEEAEEEYRKTTEWKVKKYKTEINTLEDLLGFPLAHCVNRYASTYMDYEAEAAYEEKVKEFLADRNSRSGWIPINTRVPDTNDYIKHNGRFIVSDGNRSYEALFDIYDTKKFGKYENTVFTPDNCVLAWQSMPNVYEADTAEQT